MALDTGGRRNNTWAPWPIRAQSWEPSFLFWPVLFGGHPLVHYLYLSEMEEILIDSQANAQLLTAEGISTLLNGRSDLFDELPISPDGYEKLYAHPLEKPIRIDGKNSDWEDVLDFNVGFGQAPSLNANDPEALNQFYLVLGENSGVCFSRCLINGN